MQNASSFVPTGPGVFVTTRWTVIAACRESDDALARDAIAELCQAYWRPVYLCIRHQGYTVHDAQDLTQGFFLHLLKGAWLERLDEAKGRFRAFLSVALRNFLRKRWRRTLTLRRGRGYTLVPLDLRDAEQSYGRALATLTTPETLYERQWAGVVIEQTLNQLRIEMAASGKEQLFEYFDAILCSKSRAFPFEEIAHAVGMNVNSLHGALHRWRQRYYTLLRSEIARTVVSTAEIDDELCHLQRIFSKL